MNLDAAYAEAGAATDAAFSLIESMGKRPGELDPHFHPTPADYDCLREVRSHIDRCLHELDVDSPTLEVRDKHLLPTTFFSPVLPASSTLITPFGPKSTAMEVVQELENLARGSDDAELSPRSVLRRYEGEQRSHALQHVASHLLRARWWIGVSLGEVKVEFETYVPRGEGQEHARPGSVEKRQEGT